MVFFSSDKVNRAKQARENERMKQKRRGTRERKRESRSEKNKTVHIIATPNLSSEGNKLPQMLPAIRTHQKEKPEATILPRCYRRCPARTVHIQKEMTFYTDCFYRND